MHLPLLVQTCAQRSASGVPSPPASRSRTPPTMAGALAAPSPRSIPAGSTIGQAATHLPQRVQASSVSPTRACKASRNSDPSDSVIIEARTSDREQVAVSLSRQGDRRNAQQQFPAEYRGEPVRRAEGLMEPIGANRLQGGAG